MPAPSHSNRILFSTMFCSDKPSHNQRRAQHLIRHHDNSHTDAHLPTITAEVEEETDLGWRFCTGRIYGTQDPLAFPKDGPLLANMPCLVDSVGDSQQILQLQ